MSIWICFEFTTYNQFVLTSIEPLCSVAAGHSPNWMSHLEMSNALWQASAGHTTGHPRADTSSMKSVVSSLLEEQIKPSTQAGLQLQKGDKRFLPSQAQEEHQETKSTLLLLDTSRYQGHCSEWSIVSKGQSPGQRLYPVLDPFP